MFGSEWTRWHVELAVLALAIEARAKIRQDKEIRLLFKYRSIAIINCSLKLALRSFNSRLRSHFMHSKGYIPLASSSDSSQPDKESPLPMHKHSIASLNSVLETQSLSHDAQGNFVETSTGRRVLLRGINLDSSAKMPQDPLQYSYSKPDKCGFWQEADHVSFVGKPFPLEEAYEHLTRIKLWGYNTIRYIITWEAIEHEGPGIYDTDYIDYTIELLRKIDEIGGLYVFIDPHQDVWSRFTGGSGAPLWTLYAAGLEPRNFPTTEASIVHNFAPDPQKYQKMVWATNYCRMASQVMFTLFFAGSMFAPKAIINGMNIQDFLQSHFLDAISFLLISIKQKAPELLNKTLLGVESLNEPNSGYYGYPDLEQYPPSQELRLGTCPKPIEGMRLGMGLPQEVDIYSLSVFGPRKNGSRLIDPNGVKAWVSDDKMDKHYGFERSSGWKLGECIFAQHNVWDPRSGQVMISDYFGRDPDTGDTLDDQTFINTLFVDFWAKWKSMVRKVDADLYVIMQHPVMAIPPALKGTPLIDSRTAVAQHYYDGMSLMFQTWNRKYNVDTLGILRGKYLNPVFGLVFGEKNIRKSFKNQFAQLKKEANDAVGPSVPVIITETGMPFDMDYKKAYSDGDYSSQESANDALQSALEHTNLNSTYWCYNSRNCHKWGDNWNLEDFSLYSKDDVDDKKNEYWMRAGAYGTTTIGTYLEWITNSSSSLDTTSKKSEADEEEIELENKVISLMNGTRAAAAVVRPYGVLVNGTVIFSEFDLKNVTFVMEIDTRVQSHKKAPSVIYLPELHFPPGQFEVRVTNGTTSYRHNKFVQLVEWDHDVQIGNIRIEVSSYAGQDDYDYGERGTLKALACGYL
ncbi:hypothetical protein KL949_004317 [Ogataea haglerorum]|nr:hypothetical protein KL950_000849 [Ogataea haglerorum]KAG7714633.1 hypothetical protein KL913_004403 [Ogataea haglerorum]KAG7715403.1 hypothetical protein KL949_004317 [Ogataea haglerorum]KAG7733648.1 hypothetical protein KL948_000850 [Ogataea haglerorum]